MHQIIHGDCLEEMKKMPDNSISAIVTDPPYGLGFMNKEWDAGLPHDEIWKEALRIVKPGGHLLAFGGTRTYHRLTCAIEDAGWEIRDCLMFLYGSGFPKSHNFGCKCTGDAVPYIHEKTTESASKSSMRSLPETNLSSSISTCQAKNEIVFPGMPEQGLQSNWPSTQQRNENGKESSVEGWDNIQTQQRELHRPEVCEMSGAISRDGTERRLYNGTPIDNGETFGSNSSENRSSPSQGSQHAKQQHRKPGAVPQQQDTQNHRMAACENCGRFKGWGQQGTALKPAHEPIIMAMKPCDGTFKQNAEKWGQAGINIEGCRIGDDIVGWGGNGSDGFLGDRPEHHKALKSNESGGRPVKGRWPANVIFDEFNERVLILKDSIPNDIISVIQEYYCDYKLPGLSEENRNLSKSRKKEKRTVLQSGVLLAGSKGTDEKRETSDVGQETQERICSENANEQKNVEREGQSQISGLLVQSGLSPHQPFGADTESTSVSKTDDKASRNSGTSNNNGCVPESSSHASGSCPSSEWCEERQQNRKPGNDEQLDSQNGTQGDSERTPSIEIRERTLKVLACDVPERWLKYFSDSGEEIRSPHCAAKILDEQSGDLKSGELKGFLAGESQNQVYGKRSAKNINPFVSSCGGASRFFYCAKASSRERNEGLEEMENKILKTHGDINSCDNAKPSPQMGTVVKNHHPTVKPLKLMEYLIKLIMPPKDGVLLDPFAGSGSTILAAKRLGFNAIGIEKEADYVEIARKRIENCQIIKEDIQLDLVSEIERKSQHAS